MSTRLFLAVLLAGLVSQCLAFRHNKYFCRPHYVANAYYPRRYFFVGSTITYTCLKNYRIHGHAEQKCLYGGRWNHPKPVCIPDTRQCSAPKSFDNGAVRPDDQLFDAGDRIWFRCNRGFKLNGRADLTCQKNGEWNDEFPVCVAEARQCKRPDRFDNGAVRPDDRLFDAGDRIWFRCNPGFKLNGRADLTCQKNGEWNDEFPVCVAEARQCSAPKRFDNGAVRPDDQLFDAGDRIWFRCNRGFKLNGKADLTCQKNGKWNAEFPVCVAVPQCKRPERFDNGAVRPDDRLFDAGDRIWFRCNRGFKLNGRADLTCQKNGEWNDEFPVCVAEARQCSAPKSFDNGAVRPDDRLFDAGDRIWFRCNRGFKLNGKADLTCQKNGEWNDEFPVCVAEARQCKRPDRFDNGAIRPDDRLFDAGDRIWFRCNRGFKLNGRADLTCQKNGEWNDEFPVCVAEARQCKRPDRFDNGAVRPDDRLFDAGDRIWFRCNRGFKLNGKADLTCQKNGEWNAEFPVCVAEARQCKRPDRFDNGAVRPDDRLFDAGDRIWFRCNRGFKLNGKADLTCQKNGEWNAEFPVCVGESGSKTVVVCEYSSPVYAECPRGYKIQIVSGFYGRKDFHTCLPVHKRTDKCGTDSSLKKLHKLCHNRSGCRLLASNHVFGDPCPGTRKYIELTYTCRKH